MQSNLCYMFWEWHHQLILFQNKCIWICKNQKKILMYIQDLYASVVRPVKELKAFKKEYFKPHEIKKIEFEINSEMLKFWNEKLEYILEKGEFKVYVGSNSQNVLEEKFELKK